jgi:N-acetylglucosaminyldiphosphoundecaprenol N-acetyl-beta-D-mannosaminyltransferase
VVERAFAGLARGHGGWIVTVNVDHLRRYGRDRELARMCAEAELRVADGVPLLWAARLCGAPFPDRVAGSDLVWLLAERAARDGRSLYLLGGEPGAAEAAARRLCERWPALRIAGCSSPRLAASPAPAEIAGVARALEAAAPDLVYVALGAPKQERWIHALRPRLPRAWWIGVGISLSFIGGDVARAPLWMQRSGLEWVHRLAQEPGRLARRYLAEDLPFALGLLWRSALAGRARAAERSADARR